MSKDTQVIITLDEYNNLIKTSENYNKLTADDFKSKALIIKSNKNDKYYTSSWTQPQEHITNYEIINDVNITEFTHNFNEEVLNELNNAFNLNENLKDKIKFLENEIISNNKLIKNYKHNMNVLEDEIVFYIKKIKDDKIINKLKKFFKCI